jgi:hypothetical protein
VLRLQGTCPLPFRENISWIISPFKFWTATIFLHVQLKNERIWSYVKETTSHLQNKLTNNIHLGVATSTRPPFRESISWIISPFKYWTATILLHAHLQVVYYKCAKFHKNPISGLGGVALTRNMDRRTDGRTDGQGDSYIPPKLCLWGIIKINLQLIFDLNHRIEYMLHLLWKTDHDEISF